MSSRSTRTKAKKKAFVKAHKSSAKQRAAAATVIKSMRMAKLRPGAAGVYRALLNPRVQGFLGLEKKFYDTARDATAVVTTTGWANGVYNPNISGSQGSPLITNCISVPSQGPGPQQRIGKAITIKSLQLKGIIEAVSLTFAAATPPQAHFAFLAIVLDTQTNGAQCAASDIFTNLSLNSNGLACPTRNLLNAKRFKILKSETFHITPQCFVINPSFSDHVSVGAKAQHLTGIFLWIFQLILSMRLTKTLQMSLTTLSMSFARRLSSLAPP